MFLCLKNMNVGDAIECAKKNIEVERAHIACGVAGIFMFMKEEEDDKSLFVVRIESTQGPDPKIHFTDKEKSEAFFNLVNDALMRNENLTVDILEYGAL